MGKIANAARACRETWERTCFRSDHLWLRVALPQWCFKRSLNADLFPRNAVQDNLYMWSLWVSRLRLGNEAFRSAHRYLVIHHSDLDDCTPILNHYQLPRYYRQSYSLLHVLEGASQLVQPIDQPPCIMTIRIPTWQRTSLLPGDSSFP